MSAEENLQKFLEKNSLELVEKISKGFSSEIFLVIDSKGKNLALKIERDKSRRLNMALKEASNLEFANLHGIGPKLFSFDPKLDAILMEFVPGTTFENWLNKKPAKEKLRKFLDELFVQAKKMDEIGLSHGQLQGRGKNLLVRFPGDTPVIIDFEKASISRRAKNANQLRAFLFRNKNSDIVKKVNGILGNDVEYFL
ncbi:MAG: hypothetical protein Q7K42_00445 [Candidatus Diapherotrites archaeon]|nr:hypothetical protein [Candidatus Diapherotrites archaeon]